VFKRYSFEDMKAALQEWLTPEEPEEGSIIDDEKEEEVAPVTTGKAYSIKTPASAQVSKADKFDALFEDEDDTNGSPF
jgi:hypothetical protein